MITIPRAEWNDSLIPAQYASIRTTDDAVIVYESADELPPDPPPGDPPLPALPWRDFLDLIEIDLNIRDAVDAYLATAPRRAQDEFNRTLSFERNHHLLAAAIVALNLDPAVVDAAWLARAQT